MIKKKKTDIKETCEISQIPSIIRLSNINASRGKLSQQTQTHTRYHALGNRPFCFLTKALFLVLL